MDGCIDGFDAAIWIRFGTTNCLLDSATTFDNDLAFDRIDTKDSAFFAFVVTGDDFDLVAFFDVCLDADPWRKEIGNLEMRINIKPRGRGKRSS
jgi:hypothetical protein